MNFNSFTALKMDFRETFLVAYVQCSSYGLLTCQAKKIHNI